MLNRLTKRSEQCPRIVSGVSASSIESQAFEIWSSGFVLTGLAPWAQRLSSDARPTSAYQQHGQIFRHDDAKLIGASIAGLLVALLGPIAALFVNAATFAVSALLTWAFVAAVPATVRLSGDSSDSAPRSSYWADLAEGFRFVIHDPLMRLVVGLVLVTNLLDAARGSTLMSPSAPPVPWCSTAVA